MSSNKENRMRDILAHSATMSGSSEGEGGGGLGRGLPDMASVLEGSRIEGAVCCCEAVDENGAVRDASGEDSFVGVGQAAHREYRCRESFVGECKYRVCAEPSMECMYRAAERAVASDRVVVGCQRVEAHDEADLIYAQAHIK